MPRRLSADGQNEGSLLDDEKKRAAIKLASEGFRVFPLSRYAGREKTPAVPNWQAYATSDPVAVERRWDDLYPAHNPGIATGRGLLVLDADVKKGGLESLDLLDDLGLPTSRRVRTASGGVHVYLSVPEDCAITVGADCIAGFPGIDVRCNGGLVVAPGAALPAGSYEWTTPPGVAVAAAPDWLLGTIKAGKLRPAVERTDQPLVELDRPEALAKAASWLQDHAPEAIEGAGGDQATYVVAAKLRGFGLSKEAALDALIEHWNEAKASPPWDAEDLAAKIENAYAYAQGAWGGSSGLAEFEPVEIGTATGGAAAGQDGPLKRRLYTLSAAEATALSKSTPATPLIDGMVDRLTMTVMYGDSNAGKTFVALDMGYAIGQGRSWQGRETARGLVVYIAAEGGRGILRRVAALAERYGVDTHLRVMPCAVNLRDNKADVQAVIDLVHEAENLEGAPAQLIVVDTLSRALAGGEENGSVDMGAFVKNVDRIREAVVAAMLIVHHTGKDAARGARGHSLLRAATDTEIEIGAGVIKVTKQRDMDFAPEIRFELVDVPLGHDPKGRPIKSAVIEFRTGNEFMQLDLSPAVQEMFDAFVDQAKQQVLDRGEQLENWEREAVSTDNWEASYRNSMEGVLARAIIRRGSPKVGLSSRSMREKRQVIVDSGRIKKVDENQWVKV